MAFSYNLKYFLTRLLPLWPSCSQVRSAFSLATPSYLQVYASGFLGPIIPFTHSPRVCTLESFMITISQRTFSGVFLHSFLPTALKTVNIVCDCHLFSLMANSMSNDSSYSMLLLMPRIISDP